MALTFSLIIKISFFIIVQAMYRIVLFIIHNSDKTSLSLLSLFLPLKIRFEYL